MGEDDLDARRRKLQGSLKEYEAAEARKAERANAGSSGMAGYAAAFRLSTEFVSAIVVGLVFGFALDWLFGTMPLFLIVFMMLGFAAGVLNVLRSAGLIQTPQVGKRAKDGDGDPPQP